MIVSSSISRTARCLRSRPRFSPLLTAATSWGGGPAHDGPLPADVQAVDRAADGPVGDLDRMMIPQVPTQQWGGPDGGVIAELPGVAVDHRGDQFIDGAAGRPWAAQARGVEEACPQVQLGSFLESAQPVVDGLPADLQQFRDLSDVGPVGDPEQRLGSTSLLGQGGVRDECLPIRRVAGH